MSTAASRRETESTYLDSTAVAQADSSSPPHPSPARHLQDQLQARLTLVPSPEPGRWPGIVRVPLIVGGSLAMWTVLIAAAFAAAKHVLP